VDDEYIHINLVNCVRMIADFMLNTCHGSQCT